MNSLLSLLLLALATPSPIIPFQPSSRVQAFANAFADTSRRILHQPLFPITSSSPPPPAEPPPTDPESNWPFFPQAPPQSSPDPAHAVPAAPSNLSASFDHPASAPVHLNQKITIGVSVAIAALVMVSALVFFLYRSRIKRPTGSSTKLVSGNSRQLMSEEAPAETTTPPEFLYLGTVDPSSSRMAEPVNGMSGEPSNRSPYRKLNLVQRQELHRPSPELQPLPPLNAPPRRLLPCNLSSDEETSFYSAQESAATTTNSESSHSPLSRRVFTARSVKSGIHSTSSTSHSDHSIVSQSNHLNCSIAARKNVTPPPVPPPPPPPPPPPLPATIPCMQSQQPQYVQPKSPAPVKRKAKLPTPPSPPNLVLPHLINNPPPQPQSEKLGSGPLVPPPPPHQPGKTSGTPPPPPPPPPPQAILQKTRPEETSISPKLVRPLLRPQSLMPAPSTDKQVGQTPPVVKVDSVGSSSGPSNEGEDMDETKPRLKPLHWDKVRATSDRETVWDQLKSSSFQLNEDMIETLFVCNSTNPVQKEAARRPVLPSVGREIRVLDPKKSQNIAILLRALNVTQEEVSEALLNGNPEGLGAELFETLVKMAPTKEEELKLRDYNGDISKLGAAERFLKAVLNIPFAFKRVDAMLYRANFDTEIQYLRKSFETLEAACQELKSSRLFLKLLEAVLRTGNRMNVGTNRGEAKAFKLDTLLKLADVKGTDGKTTLLHFVVQEIIRSEGSELDDPTLEYPNRTHTNTKEDEFKRKGLQVVSGLSNELSNVKKVAGMDLDVLNSYVSKLETGLQKIKTLLLHEKANTQGNFLEAMKLFLIEAENEITQIKAYEKTTLSLVKEITEYFHGDTAKEEAHPFRIFMVVRDFLSVLDQVCKEVGRSTHERTMVGSARSFRISTNASLPVFNRFNMKHEGVSDYDSSFS